MFKAFNRHNPCPVCGDTKGKCRHSDDELILCMSYPDGGDLPGWQFLKTSKDGLWGLWKPATDQPQTYFKPVTPKIERKFSDLTHEERDRHIRNLHYNLGLRRADRERLKARGLTDNQIEAGLFFSLDEETELNLHFPYIPDNFPGVFRRRGQRFLRSHRGIAVPTFDAKRLATGLQVRLESPGDRGKYRWLKNSHLNNGELPLTVAYPSDSQNSAILLTEGILKPFIAAQRHGAIAIGASGGNFSASHKQLKTALDTLNAKTILLCPDGGSVENRHVFRQYSRLKDLLDSLNVRLEVLWWGQTSKSHPDIDELDSLSTAQIMGWDEFKAIAASYGVKVEPAKSGLISSTEWMKRFGETHLIQSTWDLVNSGVRELQRVLAIQPDSGVGVECAIVPYKHSIVESIEYQKVGDLPTHEDWLEMGCPEIRFTGGRRLDLYSEAIHKGFKYLQDASNTGCGKSYDAGRLSPELLHLEDNQKIFILANNHRNPTTETIEENFADQVVRHGGLSEDFSHQTAKGCFHLKLTKLGEQPKIAANCVQPEIFHALAKRGIPLAPGSDNPVCQTCFNLEQCKVSGFLGQKRELYSNYDRIRSSIDSVAPAENVLLLDDSINEVRTSKTFEVDQLQIDRVYRLLNEQFPQHREIVLPVLRSLTTLLQRKTGKHGLGDTQTRAILPTVEDLEHCLNGSVKVNGMWFRSVPTEWLKVSDVWDLPTSLEQVAGAFDEIREGNLEEILERYRYDKHALLTAIREQLLPPWLPSLLRAIKSPRSFLNVVNNKLQITVPDYRHRHLIRASQFVAILDATLSKGDLAMVLGVRSNQILRVSQILKPTALKSLPFENLTIKIIKGIGQCGRERRESQQERINAAIRAILAQAQGRVGLIDFKDKLSSYTKLDVKFDIKFGHWFHDNRGSNEFLDCESAIAVGIPQINLNAAMAQWQILTSSPALGSAFMAWYRRKVVCEQIQFGGRLRSQLVPQSRNIWILSDCDLAAMYEAFPGAKIETLEAFQLCPEAAPKEQQTRYRILQAASMLIETGKKLTQTQLAPLADISQGRIAQIAAQFGGWGGLKKLLILLYKVLKSKTNTVLTGLSAEEAWMARAYLPLVVADCESDEIAPTAAVEEFSQIFLGYGWARFQAILRSVPSSTQAKLLGLILGIISGSGDLGVGSDIPCLERSP